ncbi:NAD(P)/FAD-dependent oxidoreductase [Rhodococcus sp. T2V]|uniref:flavin-containing monooxygenase n=1 Tax=Rhodococcus sp. T2V TaxID=3034164 RepID=UPI0023E343DA|nr:NAD(P)/FAD-dependent oxidoreductase [Rhodococcus sp. T2V]MDF3312143.1 NAD(P)/FAD-dependent oxidoreductase [Rhodococcus sp. T2V]
MNDPTSVDVGAVVVGAGFAGMYLVHELRRRGMSVRGFERGNDVGGTWYWNRYPGARCDADSVYYSFSFDRELEQEWTWNERFSTQPEILKYLNHVADRFELRQLFTFDTSVESATYDDATNRWTIGLDSGEQVTARYVVMATGCLSIGNLPDLPGMDRFTGATYHTGMWPHEGVDFTGNRVAVIGTGSSGIQAIPKIAEQATHLTVLQRTPTFTVPAQNRPLDVKEIADVKAKYPQLREDSRRSPGGVPIPELQPSALAVPEAERIASFEKMWAAGGGGILYAYQDLMRDKRANDTIADFIRGKIDAIVDDPAVADRLKPYGFPVGAKRICVDTDYYATYNRSNVTLVDLRSEPIQEVTETGVRVGDREIEVDAIVFATGYDALTGALNRINIVGKDGISLADEWAAGPRTYLGLAVNGFPNLFMITGPGSPAVLSQMVISIEQHVEWISALLDHKEAHGYTRVEAERDAQDEWVDHVNDVASRTLMLEASSWYLGANVPGKPRVFMPYAGGVGPYRAICDEVAAAGYKGFTLAV